MSGRDEANKEFQEQLRMQELYAQRNADDSDPYTYTDPEDGTVYDWDHEKKAWFPKVRNFHIILYYLGLLLLGLVLKIQSTHISEFLYFGQTKIISL